MWRTLLIGLSFAWACGGSDLQADGGVQAGGASGGAVMGGGSSGGTGGGAEPDAGNDGGASVSDSGLGDAGAVDAGSSDGGAADAGVPDSGLPDSGFPDSGVSSDAGVLVTCTASGIPGTCIDVSECRDTRRPTAGLCPGGSNIQCCTPRFTNACDPNARPRPNDGLQEAPGTGGCPEGMVRVSTFCIDRYEAFLEQDDAGTWCPFVTPGSAVLRARSAAGAVPQGYVTQVQARAACMRSGKRLCTDAEWLRACRGPSNFIYPYGNTRMTGLCNDQRSVHPAIELYGTSAAWIYSHIGSPCLNQLDGGLARSGDFQSCGSAEAVFDLMGNLHEWTADPLGTFRGGFYVDTVVNGNGCLYTTTAHDVNHWDYSTGFRCCF